MFFKKKKPELPPSEPLHSQPMAPTAMSGGQSLFAPGLNPSTPAIDFGFSASGQPTRPLPPPAPIYPPPPPAAPMASAEVISFESGLNTAMHEMAALANQPLNLPDESTAVYPRPEPPASELSSAEATFGFEQQWATPEVPMPADAFQPPYSEPMMADPLLAATSPEPVIYEAYQTPPVMPDFVDPGLPQPQTPQPLHDMSPEQAWDSFTPQAPPAFESFPDPSFASFEAGLDTFTPAPSPMELHIPTAESAAMAAFSDTPKIYSQAPNLQEMSPPSVEQAFYVPAPSDTMPLPTFDQTPSAVYPLPEQVPPSAFEMTPPLETTDGGLIDEEVDAFHFSLEGDLPAMIEPVEPFAASVSTPPVWEVENPTPPGTTFFATNEDYLKAKAAAFEPPEPDMVPPMPSDFAFEPTFELSPEMASMLPPEIPFTPMPEIMQTPEALESPLPPVATPESMASAGPAYEMGLNATIAHEPQAPYTPASPTDMDPFYMGDPVTVQPVEMPTWDSFQVETTATSSQPLTHSTAGHFLDSVNEQLYPADPFAATGGNDLAAGEQAFAEAAQILFPETMDAPLTWDEESPVTHESMANSGVYWPPMTSESDVVDLGPSFQATRGDLSDVPSVALPPEPEPVSFEWTDETSLPAELPEPASLLAGEEWQWEAGLEPQADTTSTWTAAEEISPASLTAEAASTPNPLGGEERLPLESLPPAFGDIADAAMESWPLSLNEPTAGLGELPAVSPMDTYSAFSQTFSSESLDYGIPAAGLEVASEPVYGPAELLQGQGDEFHFTLEQSGSLEQIGETALEFMEFGVPEAMPLYEMPITDAALGLAATGLPFDEPMMTEPSSHIPEMPVSTPIVEASPSVGAATSRLGHLEILGVCMLDAEKRLLVIHNGDVFALMGQAGQDNPDVSVLRIFEGNPIAYQNTFTAVPEKRPDREGLYLVQVGTWRGVVSTYQDKMTLYTDLG